MFDQAVLRKHLRETLEDLPNNVPRCNEAQLLGTISGLDIEKN
jgi:hypothetical protein